MPIRNKILISNSIPYPLNISTIKEKINTITNTAIPIKICFKISFILFLWENKSVGHLIKYRIR